MPCHDGVVWRCVAWCSVVWCGVVWCGVVGWCVVWCGVVWCGVVWCGVVWYGVVRLCVRVCGVCCVRLRVCLCVFSAYLRVTVWPLYFSQDERQHNRPSTPYEGASPVERLKEGNPPEQQWVVNGED